VGVLDERPKEKFIDQMRLRKIYAILFLQMQGQQLDARRIVHPSVQTYSDQDLHPQIHTYGDHGLVQPCFRVYQVASEDSMNEFEVSSSDHIFLWYDLEKWCKKGLPSMDERISM
jgi:hypothetical protein